MTLQEPGENKQFERFGARSTLERRTLRGENLKQPLELHQEQPPNALPPG